MEFLLDYLNSFYGQVNTKIDETKGTAKATFHQCKICSDLATLLPTVSSELSSGAAAGLQEAKDQVRNNLKGEQLKALTKSMDDLGKSLATNLIDGALNSKDGPFANTTFMADSKDAEFEDYKGQVTMLGTMW